MHRRVFEFVDSPNLQPNVLEFWYPTAGIRWHWLDSGDRRQNLATRLRQNRPEFGRCRNLAICA